MGIRFRKSINLGGGFRINLSKSGVGYSWGTKGYRITKTAKGTVRHTVSIPGTGVSFVNETGKKKKHRENRKSQAALKNDNNKMYNIAAANASNDIDGMVYDEDALVLAVHKKMRLNQAISIGIVAFLLLGCVKQIFFILFMASIAAKIFVKTKGCINIEDFVDKRQNEPSETYMAALKAVSESNMVWYVPHQYELTSREYILADEIMRVPCTVNQKLPFPFKQTANGVNVGIGKENLIFIKDRVVLLQKNDIGTLKCEDIAVDIKEISFAENLNVPSDAKIVSHTWEHTNKSGEPDRRFKDNRELPICKYGTVNFKSTSGFDIKLVFSNTADI